MDKIVQRTQRAIASRQRKLFQVKLEKKRDDALPNEREERLATNSYKRICGQAKRFQREDWRKGLLAPRRDVGVGKFTFGTVPEVMASHAPGATHAPEHLIHKGERVVVLVGRDRGRIGEVLTVNKEKKICTVKGLNKAYRTIPTFLQESFQQGVSSLMVELPYRQCDVRLVQRVGDRDVIVDYRENKYILGKGHLTLVPGSDVAIKEPEKEVLQLIKFDCDTEIADVEEATEVPELTTCPFPASIIDELRNRFSKFRTRHDAEYVTRINNTTLFEEQQADLRKRSSLTPGDELRLMWKLYRRQHVLTDDMLERIGRVMVTAGAQKGEVVHQLEKENQTSSSSPSPSP